MLADLHGAVVCCSNASWAGIKHYTLVWRPAKLDGCRQEPLTDGVHTILCCHQGLEERTQLQTIQDFIDCQPAAHVAI